MLRLRERLFDFAPWGLIEPLLAAPFLALILLGLRETDFLLAVGDLVGVLRTDVGETLSPLREECILSREFDREFAISLAISMREVGLDPGNDMGRVDALDVDLEAARDSMWDSVREAALDSAREAALDSAREAILDSAREAVLDSARDVTLDSALEVVLESFLDSALDVALEPGCEAACCEALEPERLVAACDNLPVMSPPPSFVGDPVRDEMPDS